MKTNKYTSIIQTVGIIVGAILTYRFTMFSMLGVACLWYVIVIATVTSVRLVLSKEQPNNILAIVNNALIIVCIIIDIIMAVNTNLSYVIGYLLMREWFFYLILAICSVTNFVSMYKHIRNKVK